MDPFCVVQVCIRRCKRNNFDDAIFLFAWSLASHVFWIVNLRVSVESVDIAVISNVSFVFGFFLEESFNKKKNKKFKLSRVFCGFTTRWQCRECSCSREPSTPMHCLKNKQTKKQCRWAHSWTEWLPSIAQINV